jgi:diphthine methyl ester synthase
MLYLIGLGLNEKGITLEGLEAIKKCKKIYLEGYTVDFPYAISELEKVIKKKIIKLERSDVESDRLIKEAKKENIALLVYGSPIFATTHIGLLLDCEKAKVKISIVYSASVFDAIAQTGLQLYKFGKIVSMPKWEKNFEPDSFLDSVKQNYSINTHSLILVDIGFPFNKALEQLEKASQRTGVKLEKILVCSAMGTANAKMFYGKIPELKDKRVISPYCFIIPGEMHFVEQESVDRFRV